MLEDYFSNRQSVSVSNHASAARATRYTYRWHALFVRRARGAHRYHVPAFKAAHQCEPCLQGLLPAVLDTSADRTAAPVVHVARSGRGVFVRGPPVAPEGRRVGASHEEDRTRRRRLVGALLSLSGWLAGAASEIEIARQQCRPRNLQRIRSNGPRRTARSAAGCERARARPGAVANADAPPSRMRMRALRPPSAAGARAKPDQIQAKLCSFRK